MASNNPPLATADILHDTQKSALDSNDKLDAQVIIAGAGPVGLLLALSKMDISVLRMLLIRS